MALLCNSCSFKNDDVWGDSAKRIKYSFMHSEHFPQISFKLCVIHEKDLTEYSVWSGNVIHWSCWGFAVGQMKRCLTYIIMHNWQHKQKQCNSCAPSKMWQLWKSKSRNMQEPTTKSLSAGIQLWHISTQIYADWSWLLQAIGMWSRSGQNVL